MAIIKLAVAFCFIAMVSGMSLNNLNTFGKFKVPHYNMFACNCRILDDFVEQHERRDSASAAAPTTVTPKVTTKKTPEVVIVHKSEFKKPQNSAFSFPRFLSFFSKTAYLNDWFTATKRDSPIEDDTPYIAGKLAAFGNTLSLLDRLDCTCEGNFLDVLKAQRFLRFSVTHA
ncbi:hypothetical protein L596_015925 [Steinernema carpocapsae]|uniref:Uncharacterized protein n=1 Tax=Steinernema carpocapsae TaxID=34508 RepID=A0A4U5NGG7_STECR|nr:hypothetical protein L596_015925 [Steinernema carpocapsae]